MGVLDRRASSPPVALTLSALMALFVCTTFGGSLGLSDGAAHAQTTGTEIEVQDVIEDDIIDSSRRPALQVTVTYSLINRADQSVASPDQINEEETKLFFPAKSEEVLASLDQLVNADSSKWSIVLLTDLSRPSDNADFQTLLAARTAMAKRLGEGPAANYAWFDFNKTTSLFQNKREYGTFKPLDNNADKGLLKDLEARRTTTEKTSCLYSSLTRMIDEKLKDVSGRKAILLLTHQTDTCAGQSSEADVIRAATGGKTAAERVQIFAIGVGSTPLQDALTRLTKATGGFAIVSESATDIDPGIQQMMQLMKNQREAVFTLYPERGDNQPAELTVALKTGAIKTAPIKFNSAANYVAPPEIRFSKEVYLDNSIGIELIGKNPGGYRQLVVELTDRNAPGPPRVRTIPNLDQEFQGGFYTVEFERDKDVSVGGQYSLQIFKVRSTDGFKEPLFGDRPYEFTYSPQPPIVEFVGEPIAPSPSAPTFVVTVTSNINTQVDAALVSVAQQDGATANTTATKPFTLVKGKPTQIEFPVKDLPAGSYRVVVVVRGSENGVQSPPITYTKGDLVDSVRAYIDQNPWFIAVITTIVLASIAGLIWLIWFMRSRSVSRVRIAQEGLRENMRRINVRVPETGSLSRSSDVFTTSESAASQSQSQSGKRTIPEPSGRRQSPKPAPAGSAAQTIPTAIVSVARPSTLKFNGRIRRSPFSIGRDPGNDGVLAVDGNSGVSRRHITLIYENGRWYVRDENTANGTRVNGTRIEPGILAPLGESARLTLGTNVEIDFRASGESR